MSISVDHLFANLEKYYTENNVYKSIIFCADDCESTELYKLLCGANHSACIVRESDMDDERDLYMNCIREFQDIHHRVIIISYPVWNKVKSDLEVYVLPEQNLVAFGDLCDDEISALRNWVIDAHRRGFVVMPDCSMIELAL